MIAVKLSSLPQNWHVAVIDSAQPSIPFLEYAYQENRYRALRMANPELADELMRLAQVDVERRWKYLKHLAS